MTVVISQGIFASFKVTISLVHHKTFWLSSFCECRVLCCVSSAKVECISWLHLDFISARLARKVWNICSLPDYPHFWSPASWLQIYKFRKIVIWLKDIRSKKTDQFSDWLKIVLSHSSINYKYTFNLIFYFLFSQLKRPRKIYFKKWQICCLITSFRHDHMMDCRYIKLHLWLNQPQDHSKQKWEKKIQ